MRERCVRDAGRRPRRTLLAAVTASSVATVAIFGAAAGTPAGHRAGRLAYRLAAELSILPGQPGGPVAAARGRSFRGTPAVDALFTRSHGRLGDHFCTASVVHSRPGNLLVTAAHCLTGRSAGRAGGIVFVPGFHDGKAPYGSWLITAVFVDRAWSARQDPDDDVAFLRAGRPGSRIEKVTGAERLGIGWPPRRVRLVGYPDGAGRPVSCAGRARAFGAPAGVRLRRLHRRDERRAVPRFGQPGCVSGRLAGNGDRRDRRIPAGRGHGGCLLLGPVPRQRGCLVQDRLVVTPLTPADG